MGNEQCNYLIHTQRKGRILEWQSTSQKGANFSQQPTLEAPSGSGQFLEGSESSLSDSMPSQQVISGSRMQTHFSNTPETFLFGPPPIQSIACQQQMTDEDQQQIKCRKRGSDQRRNKVFEDALEMEIEMIELRRPSSIDIFSAGTNSQRFPTRGTNSITRWYTFK